MSTGDVTYIKRLNRKIILEEIAKNKSLSRSDLSRITGLTKATITVQIQDLISEHILIEKQSCRSNYGRKPILLELSGDAGFSIGIDIDDKIINILFSNLAGKPTGMYSVTVSNQNVDHVLQMLITELERKINEYTQKYQPIGLIGIGIGIHGIVNNSGEIVFTPHSKWSNVSFKDVLEKTFNTSVYIDNNANYSAYGEQVYSYSVSDLFSISTNSGIGLGIIKNNNIYRGFHGFAGEIGHMIIDNNGLLCPCGNRGCWGLYASEKSLIKRLKEKNPTINSAEEAEDYLLTKENEDILESYLVAMSIGLNNLINIFNPEYIVINSQLISKNEMLMNRIIEKLQSHINSFEAILPSILGKEATVIGASAFALKNFLKIESLNLINYGYFPKKR